MLSWRRTQPRTSHGFRSSNSAWRCSGPPNAPHPAHSWATTKCCIITRRKEIDFVGPRFGGIAFESKYVDGGWRRDALTLRASGWQGIIATRSELDLSEPDVAALPAAVLAWLLDS